MKVISLFSGAGGLDLGFKNAGFDVVWANDIFKDAVKTYRMNIGDHIDDRDITSIHSSDLPECDGVIGGFPCQGFSLANTGRRVDDSRNILYLEFVRIVRDLKPRFFVAENVKGILSLGKGLVFSKIVEDFREAGYDVYYHLFNAADYGVPQRRERVFIFGVRKNLGLQKVYFPPAATHAQKEKAHLLGLKPWVGIGQALAGLPDPESPNNLANHEASKYKLRFNGYLGHRVIDPSVPCPTITARGDERGGVVIHHHPSNERRLTAREAAIAQSFPIEFAFFGTKTSAYRQIANAVPPALAEAVARAVRKSVERVEKVLTTRLSA